MKTLGLGLSLLAASLAPVAAQVTVQVVQEQDQFLPSETFPAAVRITNRSGEPLHLGAEPDWLTFSIALRDGSVLPRTGDVPVKGEFVVESSQVATKRVDLAPFFALDKTGRYQIVATVHIKGWDRDVVSPPKTFDIIEGARLWEQLFGVPRAGGITNTTPEVRKYMLQQANYLKGQLRLYLRVLVASGRTLRVFPIGPMVSFGRPEPLVDKLSNLHVLYQHGAHSFSYTSFNPDGELLARQTYDYVTTRPRLHTDELGGVSVVGGARRDAPNDFPPSTNDVPLSAESPGDLKPTTP